MQDILEFSAGWSEVKELMEQRASVVAIAPRYFGIWSAIENYLSTTATKTGSKLVLLSSRLPTLNGDIDYAALWTQVREQLKPRSNLRVYDCSSFLAAFGSVLAEKKVECYALIDGAGRGHEESHYRVLSSLHRLLRKAHLAIVSVDDYSSFFFQKQNFLLSDLHSISKVQIAPLSREAVHMGLAACLGSATIPEADLSLLASEIHSQTGGHPGLIRELIRALDRLQWRANGRDWKEIITSNLRDSVILEGITREMEEDADGYSATALEYRSPACPEQNSPRIQVLRQLGVLIRDEPPLLKLCGGAIARLVQGLRKSAKTLPQNRLGTVMNESGIPFFEAGALELTDDDFVIVHISDLHISEQYKHRLTWPGGSLNPNEHSAGELIKEDLESVGLCSERIDGLVLSGDFVWSGDPTEFRRASGVVQELLGVMALRAERTVFVPGNHDIEWNLGKLSSAGAGRSASRESYDDFLTLLGKKDPGELDIVTIENRSKSTRLQMVGLDSNRVEGREAAGIGFVSRESLKAAKSAIKEAIELCGSAQQHCVWLVVHHHIFPATSAGLSDAQKKIVSVMANASEVLDFASQMRVEAILHGHEHQPSVTVARRWPVDAGNTFVPITSIGAGSFGAKRDYLGPFSKNHYYIIVRRKDGILIRSREQGVSGVKFIPHSDMWFPR